MIKHVSYACSILLAGVLGNINAQERELATHGESIRFTMDGNYKCSDSATINIVTQRADSFELDDHAIQTWSDAIKDILGFECSGSVATLYFKGLTDGIEVFSADTNAQVDWLIQSEPAPLEKLALFFSLKEINLFNFGALYALHKPMASLPGIKSTVQYDSFSKEMNRLASAVDGDIEKFQSYLETGGNNLANFESVKRHHDLLLEAIQTYQPDHYESYLMTYLLKLQTLKESFWQSQAAEIVDDYSLSMNQLFSKAREKVSEASSEEFTQFLDSRLASLVEDEFQLLLDEVPDANLLEINFSADFLADLPENENIAVFSESNALFNTYTDQLAALINTRLNELTDIAQQTISLSGNAHTDTNIIIETGFALANEFEEAGFIDQAQLLITKTIQQVDQVLASDFESFRNSVQSLSLDDQIAADLQRQANIYQELAVQFEGFAKYQKVVESKLIDDRSQICESISVNAGIDKKYFENLVSILDRDYTILDVACDLYDNGHTLASAQFTKERISISVVKEDETEVTFSLLSNRDQTSLYEPVSLETNDAVTKTPELAQEELLKLVEPPPTGIADANGVRECDRLAGDPYDPQKLVSGIDFNDENVDPELFDRALDSCIAAVEDDTANPRLRYQLGRMLWLAGDDDGAQEYFNLSADQNYAAAIHHKAELLLSHSDQHNDFVDALQWLKTAGDSGYQPAKTMVSELNPDGIEMYKEISSPIERDMDSIFNRRKCVNGGMLFTTCAKQQGAKVKNCMQTSATQFECEYRVNVRCESGSNMFQNMAAAACRSAPVDWHFGRFKKLSKGWELEEVLF